MKKYIKMEDGIGAFAVGKRQVLVTAALAFLMIAGAASAFAAPAAPVARVMAGQTFEAQCWVPVGSIVRVTEPTVNTPMIVTFSTDSTDCTVDRTAQFGLNGGPCSFYEASFAPSLTFGLGSDGIFNSSSCTRIVLLGDELVQGANTRTRRRRVRSGEYLPRFENSHGANREVIAIVPSARDRRR